MLKEQVLKEMERVPDTDPLWQAFSQFFEERKMYEDKEYDFQLRIMWKGRPVYKIEELEHCDFPYPDEPQWEEMYKES